MVRKLTALSRSIQPIDSFDSRFREVWLKGLLSPFTIEFERESQAKRFQVRLHHYRVSLKAVDPASAQVLYRVKVSHKKNRVTIAPVDNEFTNVLSNFPLQSTPESPPIYTNSPSLDTPPPHSTEGSTVISIDELFSSLSEKAE